MRGLHWELQEAFFAVAARDCSMSEREQGSIDRRYDDRSRHDNFGGDHSQRCCAFLRKLFRPEDEANIAVENIYPSKVAYEFVFDGFEFDQWPRVAQAAHFVDPQHNDTAALSFAARLSVCRRCGETQACSRNASDRFLSRCCEDTGLPVETRIGNHPSERAAGHLLSLHDRDCNDHNAEAQAS